MLHVGTRNSTASGGFPLLLLVVYCYSFLIYVSSASFHPAHGQENFGEVVGTSSVSPLPLPVANVMDEDHVRAAGDDERQEFFSVSSPEDVVARVLQHKTRTWQGTATSSLELERSTGTTSSPRDFFLRAGNVDQPAATFLKQESLQLQWNHMSTELYLTLVTETKNKRMFIYRRHGRVDSEVLDVHYLLDPELRERAQEGRGGGEFLPVPFTLTVSYGSNPSFLSPFDVHAKMEVAVAFRGNGFGGSSVGEDYVEARAASRPFGALGLLTKPRVGSVVVEKKVYREHEQFDRTGASRIVKVLAGIRKELVKFAVLPAELKREVEREQAREQRRRQAALEAGQWGVDPPPAGAVVIANDRDERMIGSSMSDEEADDEEEEYEKAATRLRNSSREHEHDVLIPRPAAIVFRKLGITPLHGLNRGTLVHHTSPEWTFGPHTVRVWRVAEDVPEVEMAEEQQMTQSSSSSASNGQRHQLQAPAGSDAVGPGGAPEKLVEAVDEEEQEQRFLEQSLQRLRLDDVAAAVDDEEGEKKAKVVKLQPLREALLAGLPRDDEALLRELQLQWNYSPPEDQGPAGGAPATSTIVPQMNGAPDSVDDLETKDVFGGTASACVRGRGLLEGESSSSRCIAPPPSATSSTCRAGTEASCLGSDCRFALPAGFANSTLNLHPLPASGASSSSCRAAALPGLEDLHQDEEELGSRATDKTPFPSFYAGGSAGADQDEDQLRLALPHSRNPTPLVTPELRPMSEHSRGMSKSTTCGGGSHRQISYSTTASPVSAPRNSSVYQSSPASGSDQAALDTDQLQLLPPSCLPLPLSAAEMNAAAEDEQRQEGHPHHQASGPFSRDEGAGGGGGVLGLLVPKSPSSSAIFADCGGRNAPSATSSRAARCASTSGRDPPREMKGQIEIGVRHGQEHVNHEDGRGGSTAGAHPKAPAAGTTGTSSGSILSRCATQLLRASSTAVSGGKMGRRGSKTKALPIEDRDPAVSFSGITPTGVVGEHLLRERKGAACSGRIKDCGPFADLPGGAAAAEPLRSLEKHDHAKLRTSAPADGLFVAGVGLAPSLPATRTQHQDEQLQAPAQQNLHLVPHQLPGSVSPSDEWTPEMETPEAAAEVGQQDHDQELLQAAKKTRTGRRAGFSSLAAKALAAMGSCGSSASRTLGTISPASSCAATPAAASAAVGAETESDTQTTARSGRSRELPFRSRRICLPSSVGDGDDEDDVSLKEQEQQQQLAEEIQYLKQMHPRLTERYDFETPGRGPESSGGAGGVELEELLAALRDDGAGQSDETIRRHDPFLEEQQAKNDVEDRKRDAVSWSTETRFVFPAPRIVARPFRHPLVQKLLRSLLSSEVSLSSESGSGLRGRSSSRRRAQSQRRVGGFTFADTFEFTDEVHELARRRKKVASERLRRRRAQGRGGPLPIGADAEPVHPAVAAGAHDRHFVNNATGAQLPPIPGGPAHQDQDQASDLLGGSAIVPRRAEDFDQELFDPKDVLVLWADFAEDEQGRTSPEPVQITRLVHGVPNLMHVAVSTMARGVAGGGGAAPHVEKRVVEMLAPPPWVEQEHGTRRTSRRRRRREELLRREMEMLLPQPTGEDELTQDDVSGVDDEREVLVICTFGKVNVGGDVSTTAAPARPTRLLLLAPSTRHFAAQLIATLPNVKHDEADDTDSDSTISAADADRPEAETLTPPRLPDVTWDDDDDGGRGPSGDAVADPGRGVGQRQDKEKDDATSLAPAGVAPRVRSMDEKIEQRLEAIRRGHAGGQQMMQIGGAGAASASGQPLLAAGGRTVGGQRRRSDVTNSFTLAAHAAAARASSRAQSLPNLQQDLQLPRSSAPRQDDDEPAPSGLMQQPPPQPRPARGSQQEEQETLTFSETRVNAMTNLTRHLPVLPAAEIVRSILRERLQGRGVRAGAQAGRAAEEGVAQLQQQNESVWADDAMAIDEGEMAQVRELVMHEDPYNRNDGSAPGLGPTRPLLGRATF